MGKRYEECRYCVDNRLTDNYGHCKYCRRTISSGGNPDRFRDARVVDSTEKIERPKVPVMFDKLTLQDVHPDCYKELDIKNVIFNPPATIVFWNDGTKTVVKAAEGDEFDPEKGIAMAISKKIFGNQGSYYNKIKKWTKGYEKESDELTLNACDLMEGLRRSIKNLRSIRINGTTLGEIVDKKEGALND